MKTLSMPAFSTTLLGVIRGVADFYELPASDAMLYGCSGHAFLMNIEPTLCPSGPYCWNMEGFARALRSVGICMTPLGFVGRESDAVARAEAEAWIRDRWERGVPCSLLNREHQLITGIDATGMQTAQPWPGMDFPPARLSFGSWAELGEEIHVTFFCHERIEPLSEKEAIRGGLRYALDLNDHPERHQEPGYSVGAAAYAAWINGVSAGHGSEHGCWWNAMVWSECRERAGDFFSETERRYPGLLKAAGLLAEEYHQIAAAIHEAGRKETPDPRRLSLLAGARDREAGCIERIREALR